MRGTQTNTALRRAAADTQLDAEHAIALLEQVSRVSARTATATTTVSDVDAYLQQVRQALRDIVDTWQSLEVGLRTSQAAERLRVSEPTIRKWLDEGLLEAIPERRPVEVTPASAARVQEGLAFVREHFPARSWTDQLAAFLHDRDLQRQDWVREGVEQYERGDLVDL